MGSPVDTEKYMKPKVSSMCLANNSSLGGVVFVCCNFLKFIADKPMGMNVQWRNYRCIGYLVYCIKTGQGFRVFVG